MFEHLDHVLAPPVAANGPEYADVQFRTARLRRQRTVVATAVTVSVLVTGGVSGLALEGPAAVYSPVGGGPVLAIGDPRSTALAPWASLTNSEQTSSNACPSLAVAGRPTSSAAVAVAVTGAVIVDPATATSGAGTGGAAGGPRSGVFSPSTTRATTQGGPAPSGPHSSNGGAPGSGPVSGGNPNPVVVIPDPPTVPPPVVIPPVVIPPSPTPDPSPSDPGSGDGGTPTDGSTASDSPGPIDSSLPVIDGLLP